MVLDVSLVPLLFRVSGSIQALVLHCLSGWPSSPLGFAHAGPPHPGSPPPLPRSGPSWGPLTTTLPHCPLSSGSCLSSLRVSLDLPPPKGKPVPGKEGVVRGVVRGQPWSTPRLGVGTGGWSLAVVSLWCPLTGQWWLWEENHCPVLVTSGSGCLATWATEATREHCQTAVQ